jgi:autotransporter-associated beta strand protein
MSRSKTVYSWIALGIACLSFCPRPAAGQIFAGDYFASQVLEFNSDGNFRRTVDPSGAALLDGPAGMTCGEGSDLFVTSQNINNTTGNLGSVLRYDWRTGEFQGVFASLPNAGPSGLLYDRATNSLYVSEFGNGSPDSGKEIVRYNATTGAEIARFGIDVTGSALSGMAMDANGNLYVANFNKLTVTKFDPANNYAATPFAAIDYGIGINGLAFDRSGNLNVATMGYAAYFLPHAVYQFDSAGNPAGALMSELNFPSGLTLDGDGNLLVANMGDYSANSGSVGKYDPVNHTVVKANFLTAGPYFAPSSVAVAPNTAFWTGSGSDSLPNSWKNSDNWTHAAPSAAAAICFAAPATGGHVANENDFDAGTTFGGITFSRDAPAYTLEGNKIKLAGPVVNQSDVDTQTIGLEMELVAGGGLFDTGPKDVAVTGAITGNGSLVKQGGGTLTLVAEPSYTGSTTVAAGTLIVEGALTHSPNIAVERDAKLIAASIVADSLTIGGGPSGASVNAVPEPSAIVLALVAGFGFTIYKLRRRR